MQLSRRFFTAITITATSLAAFLFFPGFASAAYGDVTTYLGHIYAGDGGTRTDALLDFPEDLEISSDGTFYIADTYNNVIRKVSPAGVVSTLAGTGEYGNKDGASATFALPRGVALDSDGNVYVADSANNRVRKITSAGVVSTLVKTGLKSPQGVLVSESTVYIADTDGNAIRKVSTSGGALSTVSTNVSKPKKIALSADGASLYVADSGSYRVLEVNISTGAASVVAGSGSAGYWEGTGTEAQFRNIWGVTRDGNTLYVSDGNGLTDYVRAIDLTTKTTSLFATDYRMQDLNLPVGLRTYGANVYVANSGIGTIHRYSKTTPTDEGAFIGSTRFGNVDGAKASVLLGRPASFAITKDGTTMYASINNHIRKIILATGETSTIIGDIVDDYGEGPADQVSPRTRFSTISSIVLSPDDTALYLVDRWNNRVRKVTLAGTPTSSLISGAGLINSSGAMNNGYQDGVKCDTQSLATAGCAYFRAPQGIAISPDGATLYIADTGNSRIRSVRVSDGQTTLVAGSSSGFADGVGAAAKFRSPSRLAISTDGLTLYVADQDNHRIRAIVLSTGKVTTLVGSRQGHNEGKGTEASLSLPVGLAMGPNNQLYISSVGSSRITVVNTQTGIMTHVAGSGDRGYKDGIRSVACFNSLSGIAITPDGTGLYVADSWNDLIRKVDVVGGPKFSQPAPVFTKFLVNKLKQAKSVKTTAYLDIFGKNFRNGVSATIGSYKVKTFMKKSTNINMLIPLGKMKPGYYDVKITNRDTQSVIKKGAFAITDSKGKIPRTYYRIK
jgi:sugar lactone lactonase YvrE